MLCPYSPYIPEYLSRQADFRSPFTVTATMMNSLDTVTLKAFLSALAKMPHPLGKELQNQLQQLNIATEAGKLHNLAKKDDTLNAAYKVARKPLQKKENTRTKGPLPDDSEADRNDNVEVYNLSRVSVPLTEENLPEIVQAIAQSEDPVKEAKAIYEKIKYCLC